MEASWRQHLLAIDAFLAEFTAPIQRAQSAGAVASIDVAVEPEDRTQVPRRVVLDAEMIRKLATSGIALEVTVY